MLIIGDPDDSDRQVYADVIAGMDDWPTSLDDVEAVDIDDEYIAMLDDPGAWIV